jgi:hypothetical protein
MTPLWVFWLSFVLDDGNVYKSQSERYASYSDCEMGRVFKKAEIQEVEDLIEYKVLVNDCEQLDTPHLNKAKVEDLGQ